MRIFLGSQEEMNTGCASRQRGTPGSPKGVVRLDSRVQRTGDTHPWEPPISFGRQFTQNEGENVRNDVVGYYNIRRPYPFVNVDVFVDTPLVVDPQAIRLSSSPQPFAREAIDCLESFWSLVVMYVLDGSEEALAKAELLLGSFKEPKENRMGVTCGGISGRGSAHVIAKRIVAVLTHEAYGLMQAGSVGQIDLVPLFVRGVAATSCPT
ncbi:hypothetical protein FYJ24_05905 [Actinomycetaceae bacterium WB03_NA08]|uniref:Uncharacterized protein n=1 Tax=Scrofimicrobium canadense TaxID=2652290 RepID=A0A6N7W7S4_9ACTO|nr:hypothetical protein [Scrofimicrobium canadense]MSS84306.1 hypothetical protein [Scrofimicrobium canadense]